MATFAAFSPPPKFRMPKYIPYIPPVPKPAGKPKDKTIPKTPPKHNSHTESSPVSEEEWTHIDDILPDIPDCSVADGAVETVLPQTPQSLPHVKEFTRQLADVSEMDIGLAGPFDGSSPEFAIVMDDDPEDLDNASDHDLESAGFLEPAQMSNNDHATTVSLPPTKKRRRSPPVSMTAPGRGSQLDQEGRQAKRSRILGTPSESVLNSLHDSQSPLLRGFGGNTLDDDLSSMGVVDHTNKQELHRQQGSPPDHALSNQHGDITSKIQHDGGGDAAASCIGQGKESEFDSDGGGDDISTFTELSTSDTSTAALQERTQKRKHKSERKKERISKCKSTHKSKRKNKPPFSEIGAARKPDMASQGGQAHLESKSYPQPNDISLYPVPTGASLVTALVHANSAMPILSSEHLAGLVYDFLGGSGQLVRMAQLSSGSWLLVGYQLGDSNMPRPSCGPGSTQPIAGGLKGNTLSPSQLNETVSFNASNHNDVGNDDVGSQKSDSDTDSYLGSIKMRRGRWRRLDEERLRVYMLEKKPWSWIAKKLRRTVPCVKKNWEKMRDGGLDV